MDNADGRSGGGTRVDLTSFHQALVRGRPWPVESAWLCAQALLFRAWLPGSGWRAWLLRLFGARVGRGVAIKPRVRVKFPWKLSIGDYSWIGESAWIDNMSEVAIGANCCISQGAYLCTGNHDWSDPAFRLITKPITLHDGAWVGARAVICPGVTLGEEAVAAAGSVVTRDIPAREIHAGNPARFVRARVVGKPLDKD